MQQAIPYSGRTWMPLSSPKGVRAMLTARTPTTALDATPNGDSTSSGGGGLQRLVKENPVLVLGKKGCCMCHVVRRLLLGLGVNPAVCELDDDRSDAALADELRGVVTSDDGGSQGVVQLPAVFIGGRHLGGLDRLMAAHISGDLVPILKDAGALWL